MSLILTLQTHPGDIAQARALLELITDIEPEKRSDVEFCIAYTRECNEAHIRAMVGIAQRKFATVFSIRSKRRGRGWPEGPNDLWQFTMDTLAIMATKGKIKADAALTFEPDCLPMRRSWINDIKEAWRDASARGKQVLGHLHTGTHINGNAVFALGLVRLYPALLDGKATEGWDTQHAKIFLPHSEDSDLFFQIYRLKHFPMRQAERIRKNGVIPALFHGVKTLEGIAVARELLDMERPQGNPFDADYYLRGPEVNRSNYVNYRWLPELTIPVVKVMMAHLSPDKFGTVLDYGCARGYYVKALRSLGYQAFGFDISEWAIANCDPEVRAYVGNELGDGAMYDHIICKDVLEHVEEDKLPGLLSDMLNSLNDSALIIVPLRGSQGRSYVSPADNADATHKTCWTLDQWIRCIQNVIEKCELNMIVQGGYRIPGIKQSADPYPHSTGFLTIRNLLPG